MVNLNSNRRLNILIKTSNKKRTNSKHYNLTKTALIEMNIKNKKIFINKHFHDFKISWIS